MTLLSRKITLYYRCIFNPKDHRFQRSKPDRISYCPICGGPVKLYGLADSTRYSEDPDDGPLEDVPGS